MRVAITRRVEGITAVIVAIIISRGRREKINDEERGDAYIFLCISSRVVVVCIIIILLFILLRSLVACVVVVVYNNQLFSIVIYHFFIEISRRNYYCR